ncbi:Transcriptional activator of proteases prtT [Trametes pubescens]|uniref:Transcriptional activator of proteases prtT n=1 Tax=Trametes pubescens TaxID=154538 RepID=A0A1M2VHB7_TRAPU|nr:Transcriptional activator of proteases prtT [Trametes pubescens]
MSLSPTTSNDYEQPNGKRRRTASFAAGPSNGPTASNGPARSEMGSPSESASGLAAPPTPGGGGSAHIPKRGARACTNCRKGKNRCEGEVMQSQMIGMQSSLDRILSAIQSQNQALVQGGPAYPPPGGPSRESPVMSGPMPPQRNEMYGNSPGGQGDGPPRPRAFPPLPGFAPPPHKYATYGIVPSTAPSSDDESEDTLPRSTLNAPIEALQGLANAAAEAAAAPSTQPPRVKKRKRAEPTPRNAFPHVVEKGLVSDAEARELYHIFFSGCHIFIPVFDPTYDTYEGLMERSPWTFDAILAVAAKIRSGTGPLIPAFYKCLEEAQGIARSSLFGPVVRKEAVQGMLLLAAWSTNGWLPSGHAMRMALDLGLHRALEKLADDGGKKRSEEEERNLVVSARIWLCLYWFDHQMSLGTGRPIVLRDESSIRHCRVLLSHPMVSPTDVRLVSQVELIAQKTQIYETLSPLNGQVNHNTLSFIRRANIALDKWWADCDELHRQSMDDEALPRKILAGELHYAKLWLVCVALRGVSWDKMPFEQRELAFQAKDAASNCLSNLLDSHTYRYAPPAPPSPAAALTWPPAPVSSRPRRTKRAALRYAVHDSLVMAAFSGLFLLKMANLFPAELDLGAITVQVEQLAQVLSDVAAERYALTLRIMLANLRRKIGLTPSGMPPQGMQGGPTEAMMGPPPTFIDPSIVPPPPFTVEEVGAWANDQRMFNPAAIPLWLQEQSLTDLGLPQNGSDGIFLNVGHTNGWMGDFPPMPEAW